MYTMAVLRSRRQLMRRSSDGTEEVDEGDRG